MPLALSLLLVLPIVGALHRNNEIFVPPTSDNITRGYEEYTREEDSRALSVTKILPEGQVERIARWKGICTKETIVDWGHTNVALREIFLGDSERKLQLIYEGDRLTDCIEANLNDDDDLDCSFNQRKEEKSTKPEMRIEVLEGDEIYENFPIFRWLDSRINLRERCVHARARAREQSVLRQKHRRIGRSLQRMVIAPGTKWCGPHRTANTYKELGALDHVDRCCRRHDHCYRAIPPFSERYNLWNYMPFTLSHCGCDQSFRTCLKMAGTSSANFIGRIFFNVVQTKCFVLKPHKVCTRQSWWGKCEKHEYKKQAHLRNNVPY
ncbi:group 3 secretory phospholipase A2-like isoform X2 [Venturia canescens]|uniref:group 3 secretory phospholipase A2-like isoform X2 n=1 Tax=Venturia canescens TaxID=32260 RepID=UPI001C9C87E4|nr:group 3 secretory phospholipase A2-like isoform X2 [Venturia canescens]